jgi:hypothetical protein
MTDATAWDKAPVTYAKPLVSWLISLSPDLAFIIG